MAEQESSYAKVQIILVVVFVLFAALFLGGLFCSFWRPPSLATIPGAQPSTPTLVPSPTPTMEPTTPPPTASPTSPPGVPTHTPTPTPTTPPGTPGAPIVHVVQRGENLFRIALRYNTTVEAIARANNIVNPRLIYAGQTLRIPSNGASVSLASQPTNATVTPPTATATPTRTPTVSPTATPAQEPATPTPSREIENIPSERFGALAAMCFGAIGAFAAFFGFVSTTVLSWQKTSRALRRLELEKTGLEVLKLKRELEQSRKDEK